MGGLSNSTNGTKANANNTTSHVSASLKTSGLTSAIFSMFSSSPKQATKMPTVAPPHVSCPSKCSSHGICHSGTCYCHQGFQGQDCGITVKKEFVTAESQLVAEGIIKWAAGSFIFGFAMITALHPLYSKIKEDRNRIKKNANGPMIDMQRRYY